MGAPKWGLKATLCNLRTIVYNCALLWPFWALSKGDFRYNNPDPPILAFFDFLAFFFFRFSLLFLAFFLPFPRILGVPRREKPLLFLGENPAFSKKARFGGSENCRQLWTIVDKCLKPHLLSLLEIWTFPKVFCESIRSANRRAI